MLKQHCMHEMSAEDSFHDNLSTAVLASWSRALHIFDQRYLYDE